MQVVFKQRIRLLGTTDNICQTQGLGVKRGPQYNFMWSTRGYYVYDSVKINVYLTETIFMITGRVKRGAQILCSASSRFFFICFHKYVSTNVDVNSFTKKSNLT